MPLTTQNGAVYGYGYYRTLIGSPMLEVKPTGHRGRTATGSGRNGPGTYRFAAIGAMPFLTALLYN